VTIEQQPAVVSGGVCGHLEGGADQEASWVAWLSPAASAQGGRAEKHSIEERVYRARRTQPHTEVCFSASIWIFLHSGICLIFFHFSSVSAGFSAFS